MNAGSADTHFSHLDLGDLIAQVSGQPIDDRARGHLAGCEICRTEANRWDLVAGGVRGLAATAPEAAQQPEPQQPQPQPRQRGPRILASPGQRTVLAVSAAAGLVLLGAIGYAVTTGSTRHISGGSGSAGLTAVGGCSALEQASGMLEQVNGSSLVIKTASGQLVTVTTTASTFMSMSGPLLSEITNGASVMVRGSSSGGTIAAAFVTVGQPFSAVSPPGFVPVRGTVSDASAAGFTLVTTGGTRIPVTTSAGTLVVVPHASPGQLQDGAATFALGHAGPDGTLSAQAVATVAQLPQGHTSVSARGCSPASIAEALGVLSGR
jgi:hypothetical protein